jgi:hypothetical protein
MLLLLKPSATQQSDLDKLLAAQQTPGNASFHKWLTISEFAQRFGPSAKDTASVTTWLQSQGFSVDVLPTSRGWIEFSGTAAQLQKAFGTGVTKVSSSGIVRYRLSSPLQIPAAVAATVQGLVSLDGSESIAASTWPVELSGSASGLTAEALAAQTSLRNAPALTPSLVAAWLHLPPTQSDTATGAGESIAIPTRSNVRAEDYAAFRRGFNLPPSRLDVHLTEASPGSNPGSDPGRTADEAAAVQAASWAGAMAPGAQIVLVPAASTNATDGLDLALAATIDSALAHTVSVGYTTCEASLSATHQAFYAALYRQAAAEGIAIVAATGDSGAAACHRPEDTTAVTTGYAVNGLASTPWNTAVGAVAFTDDASTLTGWQPVKSTDPAYATAGGFSHFYPTPDWQSASGLPASDPDSVASHHRYLPDLSLPTALTGMRGLAFCLSAETASGGCRVVSGGGSGVSAAIFSGIAALLAQKYGPQGNLAPNLYVLNHGDSGSPTAKATQVFEDITTGSDKLHCAIQTPNCTDLGDRTGEIGFSSADGYDLVTGLGSINAKSLIERWATPQVTGTAAATVEMTSATGITYNPSATITLSAKVISGSGGTIPTGTIQFYDQTTSANTGTPVTLAADGTASYKETGQFTDGGHNIEAQYSGDATYAAAISQPVTINVQPSPTSLIVTPSTLTPTGGSTITVTGTVTATNPGATAPTGALTVNLDGVAQGNALVTTVGTTTSASVSVIIPTAGSHTIQGTYAGDLNYNGSTSPAVSITVLKTATVTTISATPSTLTTGVPETFTATIAPATAVTGTVYVITGTVSFYDQGATLLGTAPISSNTAILTGVSLSNTASHTITAVYSGDATFSTSVSSPLLLAANLLPVTVVLTESSAILTPDQPVSLVATITPVNTPPLTAEQNPSGYVLFYANSTLISGQVPVKQGLGDTGVASTTVPHLPAGQYVVTAQYSGDPTYGPAVSNSLNLQAEDFSINCDVATISMVQGSTQSVTCNVASLGGFTGPIQVVCAEQNPPQVGAISCSFNPSIVTGTGATTLTITTTRGNISKNELPGSSPWPTAGGGIALAFAGLLLSPIGRRARLLRSSGAKLLALVLLLVGLAGAGLGCGNTVTLRTQTGTPLGLHTLQLTAGADVNTVTVTHNAYLTVNVTP